MLDIVMLVFPGGQERTEEEYAPLLAKAGFRLNRVVPTASGRAFFSRARVAHSELRKAEEEAAEVGGSSSGSVTFGVGPTFAALIVPHAVARFLHFGIGQADQRKARQAVGEVHLDRNRRRIEPVNRPGPHHGQCHADTAMAPGAELHSPRLVIVRPPKDAQILRPRALTDLPP